MGWWGVELTGTRVLLALFQHASIWASVEPSGLEKAEAAEDGEDQK